MRRMVPHACGGRNGDLPRAADAGLVRAAPPFRIYREKRNVTSHAYDENRAEQMVRDMDAFVDDMRFLLTELKRRNR